MRAWSDLYPALEAVVAPLRGSGWAVVDDAWDESDGEAVALYVLERDGIVIEIQRFADGATSAYQIGVATDPGEHQPVLMFSLEDASPAACADMFAVQGWLA